MSVIENLAWMHGRGPTPAAMYWRVPHHHSRLLDNQPVLTVLPLPSSCAAGTNCNKSCYNKPGLLATKKILYKLCGVSGVQILSTTPPNIADMATFCQTYIYQRFPSPAAMVKYQNCEANQALYNKNMYPVKAPATWWCVPLSPLPLWKQLCWIH